MQNITQSPSSDSRQDTPEKRLLLQSLAQKLFSRICEINLNTPHNVVFAVRSHELGEISVDVYWFVNNAFDQARAKTEFDSCYYWLSSDRIEQWFLTVHSGLDQLEAETKAA